MVKVRKSEGKRQRARWTKLRLLDQHKWDKRLKELAKYNEEHQNCNVPRSYSTNPQLGEWVTKQRYLHKKGKLLDDRVRCLEELGFKWVVGSGQNQRTSKARKRVDQKKWDKHFKDLQAYRRQHGNCDVPTRYDAHPSLGDWVGNQRQRKETLSPERVERLEELGFHWSPGRKVSEQQKWNKHFKELKAYKRNQGDCNVPQKYPPDPQLGRWVDYQPCLHKKGELSDDRVELLEELGFDWGRTNLSWDDRFKELKAYQRKHGNCDVPRGEKAPNPELGSWVGNQRSRKGMLSDDRVERLNQLGFKWVIGRGGNLGIRCPTAAAIGEVGYVFRKQFDDGWYNGEVTKIRPGAAKGKDRRCRYTDGDEEDLSMGELQTLANLARKTKMKKKCSTGAVAACSSTAARTGNKSSGFTKPVFCNPPKKVSASGVYLGGTRKTPRQLLCPKACDKALHDRRD